MAYAPATRCPVLTLCIVPDMAYAHVCMRVRYAMCGTDMAGAVWAYERGTRCAVLMQRMVLCDVRYGCPTATVCDVRCTTRTRLDGGAERGGGGGGRMRREERKHESAGRERAERQEEEEEERKRGREEERREKERKRGRRGRREEERGKREERGEDY
eukprot:892182-Rhodomonas_salina.3